MFYERKIRIKSLEMDPKFSFWKRGESFWMDSCVVVFAFLEIIWILLMQWLLFPTN
jgi:hypothetical protein